MEAELRQRSAILKQKCERVQEVLLEMKTRTKSYYENLCKSRVNPGLIVPHWYQASNAEYETMLRIHKKEAFDYACITDALKKIQEAEDLMDILKDESETRKWFRDQLSPLQPELQDKGPRILLQERVTEKLDYAADVNNEVERSYNKGVWNRNEQAKQQKMEAVMLKKDEDFETECKKRYDKRSLSKTWMRKIFLKKRSASRDSFFESREEEMVIAFFKHLVILKSILFHFQDVDVPVERSPRRQRSDGSITVIIKEMFPRRFSREIIMPRRSQQRQQSLPDLFSQVRPKFHIHK